MNGVLHVQCECVADPVKVQLLKAWPHWSFCKIQLRVILTVQNRKCLNQLLIFQFLICSFIQIQQRISITNIWFTLYQDKFTTDKKPTVGYSIPDEIPTTCFQL